MDGKTLIAKSNEFIEKRREGLEILGASHNKTIGLYTFNSFQLGTLQLKSFSHRVSQILDTQCAEEFILITYLGDAIPPIALSHSDILELYRSSGRITEQYVVSNRFTTLWNNFVRIISFSLNIDIIFVQSIEEAIERINNKAQEG